MNAHITKNNNISAGTVARTAVLGLALANQILSACGKPLLPIDSAQLEQWVCGPDLGGGHLGMVGEQLLYQRGAGGGQLSGAAEEGRALTPYMTRAAAP